MSQPSTQSPIPRVPAGPTFRVAAGLLVLFFLVQVGVVALHYAPLLQKDIVKSITPQPTPQVAVNPSPAPLPVPQSTPPPATAAEQLDEALLEKIRRMVDDSDKAFRIGDYDAGMAKIQEADKLLPRDPGIMLRIGRLYEKKGDMQAAAESYKKVLELPELPTETRAQTQRKIAMLSLPESTPIPTVVANEAGADMRDEFGLQPGASLGIIETRLSDAPKGAKNLRISIKARPNQSIDPRKMAVHVFFYERDQTGLVELTNSEVLTEWISPPVDWSNNEPELLNAAYTPPAKPDFTYAGYVVGIYYKNDLQDTRADPGSLAVEHPLPLYLSSQP
jgi:tetratricopeptide (TPR) repeat protein